MYPFCRFRPWLPTGCPFCGQSYPYDGVPRPFFGTEWPCRHSGLPSRMCARTFPCSGRGSCSLRTPRPRERAGASFFLELQDAIERVWEEWTPTADVRGMMHFGDRSQPLSVLPGQRANSARPDPRRECPSGTAAWRTRAGHQSPRAGVASRSRGARPASVPRRGRPHSSAFAEIHPQSHAYSPRPEGRPPLRPIPAPAHPATCPLPNHLLPDIGNKTR